MALRALPALLLSIVALCLAPAAGARGTAGMTFLDNGVVRVGVDLLDGGKITFVGHANGESDDLVRDIQQSYYSGPLPSGGWFPGWHAFASGGQVVDSWNDGRTIYTRTIATQEGVGPCECAFETWVRLDGAAVRVRERLTNFRSDATQYPALPQELPALYTQGPYRHVFTYRGAAPYTGDRLTEITDDAGGFFRPGPSWLATEHWAALVDDEGEGIGLFNPQLVRFAGTPGTADGGYAYVNGYLTSSTPELLDANAVYTYGYTLLVGSLEDIRDYAYAHRPDPRPDFRFAADRRHWTLVNARDSGSPIRGALHVSVDEDDPQLVGPEEWFRGRALPRLYVRGRWHTQQRVAQLFWADRYGAFSEGRSRTFTVVPGDRFGTYRLQLGTWLPADEIVTRLRLDPVAGDDPGGFVEITCISWRPCPVDRRAEARLLARGAVPFLDSFDGPAPNAAFWQPFAAPGTFVQQADGELELSVAAAASPDPATGAGAGVRSRCSLLGDFDLQVDYRLLDWPEANGVNVNFGAGWDRVVSRTNLNGEQVSMGFGSDWSSLPVDDRAGSLRLVRSRGTIAGYVRRDGVWFFVNEVPAEHAGTFVTLTIWTGSSFVHRDVRVAFDNFRVSTGRLLCP